MTDNTQNIDIPLEGTTWPADTVSFTPRQKEDHSPVVDLSCGLIWGNEIDSAIDRANAWMNRAIDPLELIQELDKLQRYQNGVRFFPENLRRGQLKTKDVMAVIERLMGKSDQTTAEPDPTPSTKQLQAYGRSIRQDCEVDPVQVIEIDYKSAEESVLTEGYSPRLGVWAPKSEYDALKELDKSLEEEFRVMMYGKK